MIGRGQRPAFFQPGANGFERQEMIEPILVDLAQRHCFDQSDRMALGMRPGDQVGQLVLLQQPVHALVSGLQALLRGELEALAAGVDADHPARLDDVGAQQLGDHRRGRVEGWGK